LSSASTHQREESGFDRFQLDHKLVRGLRNAGFQDPRPIQADTIPAALEGRDVMGLAQTGTGKTAAFGLPILQRLIEEPGEGPLVLILAPTRELARQIEEEIRTLAKFTRIETTTIFGGVPIPSQAKALRRRPEIVVGCPGRVLDLVNRGLLDLSEIETLVLDEADHMFDLGFLPDIKRIVAKLPDDRQNLFFSATMPREIRKLADEMLHEPCVVELAHTAPAERIEHYLVPVEESRKKALLDVVLAADDCASAIVFTRTKHRAKRMAQQLDKAGHRAVALQGNMSQSQRDRAMRGFREGKYDILVATDIAARGLDVAGIDYVINFDPPSTPETYTHRIGRTGRSDASGKACTFVTADDRVWLRDTEKMLGDPIVRRTVPGFDGVDLDARGGARKPSGRSSADGRGRSNRGSGRGRGQGRRDSESSGGGRGRGRGSRSQGRSGGGRSGASRSASPR
jgi:superfamily II DNA/RNA helicase